MGRRNLQVFQTPRPLLKKKKNQVDIRVTPSQSLYMWSLIHSLLGVIPPQTWDLGSHVHCPQGNPTSQTLYLGSHV